MGIGSIFGGIAEGFKTGSQLAIAGGAMRQKQQLIDIEQEKADVQMQTLKNSLDDAKAYSTALQPVTQATQQDSAMFGFMSSLRDLAVADPTIRKTQLPVLTAKFKQVTGMDLAPNVLEAFKSGNGATLSALIDSATQSILKNGTSAQDVVGLLTDPARSSAWLGQQGAKVAAAGTDGAPVASPQESTLGVQVGLMNRRATYLRQSAERLVATLPRLQTAAAIQNVYKQIDTFNQQAATLEMKAAELGKPMGVAKGTEMVDPLTNEVLHTNENGGLLSPVEYQQKVALAGDKAKAATNARLASYATMAGLSKDAVDLAAADFLQGKPLPAVGMGIQGFTQRAAIYNRAAELAAANGDSASAAAARRSLNQNAIAANRQMQAQASKVSAFEATAMDNIELLLKASAKADRTGVPAFNRWLNAGRQAVAGDPDVAELNTLAGSVANEYARIVTTATGGGVTTDSARQEAMGWINGAMTHEQLTKVLRNAVIPEMKNRIKGFQAQTEALRTQLRGDGTAGGDVGGTPGAGRSPASPSTAPTGGGGSERVRVLAPNGQRGTIDRKDLPDLLRAGGRVLTPE